MVKPSDLGPRPPRRRPCPTPDKLTFRSAAAARRWHRTDCILPTGHKERLYPYRCPCGQWHLTHQTPTERAEIAAHIARKAHTP